MTNTIRPAAVEPVLEPPGWFELDTAEVLSRRDRLLRALHLSTYRSGLSATAARLSKRSSATILLYHSVPEPDEAQWMDPTNCLRPDLFERQMAFLARRRHVISLDRLLQMLEDGEPFISGTVVVTFDDGYRNNLTVAAPILSRHGIPATIFLNTGSVETGSNQWIDDLYSAFCRRTAHRLDLTAFQPGTGPWVLGQRVVDATAYRTVAGLLIDASASQRDDILSAVVDQLAPSATPPRMTMTWDEVRTLVQQHPHITLGVHGTNHIDLRRHSDQIEPEARSCINQFERNTGNTPEHFAFPYNRHHQASEAAIARFFRSSVGENPTDPVVRPAAKPHGLQRLTAPQSMALLRSYTDGGYPNVSQRLLGRVWYKPY